MDKEALERKLKAQEEAARRMAQANQSADRDNAHLFEEFKRAPQPGEAPKPKGLNAQGYQFPPPTGPPAMTKENLAKGVGLPPSGSIVPPMPPPSELVAKEHLFEEYQRPDLKHHPRTGKGLRHHTEPKSAKEILSGYEPPTPQVVSGKRDPAATPPPLPRAPAPIIQPARATPNPSMPATPPARAAPAAQAAPATHATAPARAAHAPSMPASPTVMPSPPSDNQKATPESDAAHLDAEADLASAPELTMSHSRSHGPTKTVTDHDPFAEMPNLPGGGRKAKGHNDAPHVNDSPPVEPGDGPRLAVVQADFNYGITTRMAQTVRDTANELGCDLLLHVHVAGVFDIPLVAKALAARNDVDAVVAVGCVIQGETGHDQLIATECARKLADLTYESGKPVGLAVTGPRMTRIAAEARAGTAPKHAVEAVVKQWRALKSIGATRVAAR